MILLVASALVASALAVSAHVPSALAVACGASAPVAVLAGVALVTPGLVRSDLRHRRLPNRLVGLAGAAVVLGIVLRVVPHAAGRSPGALPPGSAAAVVAVATAAAVAVVLAAGGGLGMGDAKLAVVLTAAAAVLSPGATLVLGAAVGVGAGLVGGWEIRRRAVGGDRGVVGDGEGGQAVGADPGVPFGPVLLAAFWTAAAVTAAADVFATTSGVR
ncbi:type IV leader peptidase family protein [Frigoribacterium sp. PhB160]|uniref:prepilin peptidase n=1 Tax=Frigoribacterium sp. PhB160 TaxID=2485192 RepID=UPI000F4879C6|nr:prepilin peptidase [Frigoribacterium sp. PhB160]ROS59398.1 type IV leader peptidase family protein [Frigoribacterium sp. PhB160]